MRKIIGILIIGLAIIGCERKESRSSSIPAPSKITNIEHVLFMGKGSYTIFTIDPETKEMTHKFLNNTFYTVKVFVDLPKDEKPWVDVEATGRNGKTFTIHLADSKVNSR